MGVTLSDWDEAEECTICGGDGWDECDDPIQCCNPGHVDADLCPCKACGGSGRGQDQVIW